MRAGLRLCHVALAVANVAVFALLASPVHAEVRYYNCVLHPLQVQPPVTGSRAAGAGQFAIDTDANTVSYWIVFTKLAGAETAAHIHGSLSSTPGNNAAIRATLPAGNPKVGVWSYTEDLETTLLGGLAYVDIHDAALPGGELRGQIVPLNASLNGSQVVGGSPGSGIGWATVTIDQVAHQLNYFISYSGLGAVTAAHFHGPALHAAAAPIKANLSLGVGLPMTGTVSYALADEPAILSGLWYVELHTASGDIRGQICPVVVPMDGAQTVPPSLETGSAGFAMISIDTLANALSYDIHVDSVRVSQTGEHFHGYAPAGATAPSVVSLTPAARRIGVWTYGAANESQVLQGHVYIDSHTSSHPNGEIRGQLLRLPGAGPLLAVGGPPRAISGLTAAPNPFAGRTRLSFQLASQGPVSISILDVEGRVVRHFAPQLFTPGSHTYQWDGCDNAGRTLAAGLYFAQVRTPDGETVTRLSRLK